MRQQVDHLDGSGCGFPAFVARLRPGPLDSLLDAIGREYAESHRDACLKRHLSDPFRDLTRDVLKVGCCSSDHASDGNDAIVVAAIGRSLDCQRDFKGAWDPDKRQVLFRSAMSDEGIFCAFDQSFGDETIPPTGHDGPTVS